MPDSEPKVISQNQLAEYALAAQSSPRKRKQRNMHDVQEPIQRIIRVLQPTTYMQPHRQLGEAPFRLFVLLKGSAGIIFFNDNGETEKASLLHGEKGNLAIEVPGSQFFSVVCLEKDTSLLEVREGPINKDTREILPGFPDELKFLTRTEGDATQISVSALLEKWKEDLLNSPH